MRLMHKTSAAEQCYGATVIFSGDLNPNHGAVRAALVNAGFEVVRMPERFRPTLTVPGDDFFEVFKRYPKGNEWATSRAMSDTLDSIIEPFVGVMVDEIGPCGEDHIPFSQFDEP